MEKPVKDKEKTCRICYQQNTTMVPIFIEKLGVSPYENLVHHTNLNIAYKDGGSKSICMPCSEELEILVKFLNKCVKANDLFAISKQNRKGSTKSYKDASKNDKDASQSDSDDDKLIINEDSVSSDNEQDPNKAIQNKITKHECQCCHKKFTRSQNLRLHLYRHNGERKHFCLKCGAGVLTRALAQQHCAPRPRRPCPTPGCKMTFLSSQNLQSHMRKHTGEKPFECAHCHKKFRSKSTLCGHMKIHSDIKPYKCPVCGKQFATNKLPMHMRTHTPSIAPAPRTYTCTVCPRSFNSVRSLARHGFMHGPKLREHICNICKAAYNHKKSLNKHIKKVHSQATTTQTTTTTAQITTTTVQITSTTTQTTTTATQNPDSTDQPMTPKMDSEVKQ